MNLANFELQVDNSKFYSEEQLAPLIGMIWKVVRFVDNRVHLQQAAGTTKVGYNSFYNHKLAQINGLYNYSGTKANREYWSHDTMDAKKEILRIKAHERLLSSGPMSRVPPRNVNSSANQDGSPTEVLAQTKRNRHQCQLYNKGRKAKRVHQKAQINQKQNVNISQAPATAIKSDL